MGILDNLKNVLSGRQKDDPTASTAGPSQTLRDAGIDPSGLKFAIRSDGTLTVTGTIASDAERASAVAVLQRMAGIERVEDEMTVAAQPGAAAPTAEEDDGDSAPEPLSAAMTYTVQSGDTLWKIAADHYGDGSRYLRIFEANRDVLEDPDRIFPGQELKIPPLTD